MKKRIGFVSNSSSASFVIKNENITELQRTLIINHIEAAKLLFNYEDCRDSDAWSIDVTDDVIKVSTGMDNFDMWTFLYKIGIPNEHIEDIGYS